MMRSNILIRSLSSSLREDPATDFVPGVAWALGSACLVAVACLVLLFVSRVGCRGSHKSSVACGGHGRAGVLAVNDWTAHA